MVEILVSNATNQQKGTKLPESIEKSILGTDLGYYVYQ
jgi:hypothetical protein